MKHTQKGFTIYELLVVLAIMATLFGVVAFNFNATRSLRNVKITINELVSNLRVLQQASLTGKDLITGSSASPGFYVVRLDATGTPTAYSLIKYGTDSTPYVIGSTVRLLNDTTLYAGAGNYDMYVTDKASNSSCTATSKCITNCVEIGFELPFGRVYIDRFCDFKNSVADPNQLQNRYKYANLMVEIGVRNASDGVSGTVTVDGTTGRISTP